jgi:hypothetical protein
VSWTEHVASMSGVSIYISSEYFKERYFVEHIRRIILKLILGCAD